MRMISSAVRVTYFALASALCIPASAAPSGEVFVKLPPGSSAAKEDGSHKDHIEILSYSFGSTGQFGEWIADVERPAETVRANDRLRAAGPVNSGGMNQMSMDDTAGREKMQPGGGHATSEMTLKGSKIGENAPAASGLPTGKRQHKPFTLSMPVDKGSVMLKLASAWPNCQVGKRYSELEIGDGAKSFTLQDAVVSSCASESVSLNYSKVKVRGWDPEKKEE